MIEFLQTLYNTLNDVSVSGYDNISRMTASMGAIVQMLQQLQAEEIANEEMEVKGDGRQVDIGTDGGNLG